MNAFSEWLLLAQAVVASVWLVALAFGHWWTAAAWFAVAMALEVLHGFASSDGQGR